jgi:hypothetical protein
VGRGCMREVGGETFEVGGVVGRDDGGGAFVLGGEGVERVDVVGLVAVAVVEVVFVWSGTIRF